MSVASLDQRLMARKGRAAPAGGRRHEPGRDPTEPMLTAPGHPTEPPAEPAEPAAIRHTNGAAGAPAKLTLRLPPDQHRRLRVAAACWNTTMQALMTAALDRYLADADDVCTRVAAAAAGTGEAGDA